MLEEVGRWVLDNNRGTNMNKTLWLASTAIVAAMMMAAPAYAGGKTKTDTRDQEIQELKARLDRLERESEDEKIQNGARLKKVEDTQDAVQWTFADGRPTIRSGDGRFEMSLRGRVQLDWAAYQQDNSDMASSFDCAGAGTNVLCDLGNGAVFRRVRFGVEGRFFRDFIYELRFDFAGTDVEGGGVINIARVGYVGIPGLRIQAGAMQPIFTLYDSTSSAELTTMERAAIVTSIVGPFGADNSRRGVEVTYQKENLLWDGDNFLISSAFTGNRTSSLGGCEGTGHTTPAGGTPASQDDECTQLLGRIAYRLWSDGESNVQIGASGATILSLQGVAPTADRTVRFRERPEVRVSGERFVDTGAIPADGGHVMGFEAGANYKNFYVAGEYYKFEVDRDNSAVAGANPEFSGWYVEGEWIFTGENKRYVAAGTNNNIAVWRGPSVTSPWSLGGGLGAWSLTGRYSVLDLNWNEGGTNTACANLTQCIRGGEQTVVNLGVTWYLNSNIKLMTEYAMVDIDRQTNVIDNILTPTINENDLSSSFDIIQGRMMFTF
jgi:phosphate-selective porin OprO/OprP